MKNFIDWLVKNFSNVFSIIGIILTIYFGVFYIPNYVEQVEKEKIKTAKNEIILSIQEYIYNHKTVDDNLIRNLIRGKELQYQIILPYNPSEILIQSEVSIIDQKFISIDKRVELVSKVDSLIKKSSFEPIDTLKTNLDKSSSSTLLQSWLSIILTLLATIIATYSLFIKLKKEKEIDVQELITEKEEEFIDKAQSAFEFENKISNWINDIIKESPVKVKQAVAFADRGWDIRLDVNDSTYLCMLKFLSKKSLSSNQIDFFAQMVFTMKAKGIIITNKFIGITAQAHLNKINDREKGDLLYVIDAESETLFKEKIKNIIAI